MSAVLLAVVAVLSALMVACGGQPPETDDFRPALAPSAPAAPAAASAPR